MGNDPSDDRRRSAAPVDEPVLDRILDGGFPRGRATLVVGEPGSGKSTLGIQFLQAGLDRDERCLLVSTEQTPAELADSFRSFPFDLDHEKLTITSVHAAPDETLQGEEQLTVKTIDGGELLDTGFGIPFESGHIQDVLKQYGPADRVLVDSVSGFQVLSRDADVFRRAVLDLIRMFSDDFGATTLFTAEGTPGDRERTQNPLRFTSHGVVRLWLEEVGGSLHRFARVEKLRGVDHDTRRYQVVIDDEEGIRLAPKTREVPPETRRYETFETGIEGFDELTGGLPKSGVALFEHDGRANVDLPLVQVLLRAIETDRVVVFVPSARFGLPRVRPYLREYATDLETLMDEDRLHVISAIEELSLTHRNVHHVHEGDEVFRQKVQRIHEITTRRKRVVVFDLEALLQSVTPEFVEEVLRQVSATMMQDDDTIVYVTNRNAPPEDLKTFLGDVAMQTVELWQEDDGLEYLKLAKSQSGAPGTSRLIEYLDEPPFVRLH